MLNRVQIIHNTTGTSMWVADAEVEKFLAAGHKLAAQAPSEKPAEKDEGEKVEEIPEPKKAPLKKPVKGKK